MQEVHDLRRAGSTGIINSSYSSSFPKDLIGLMFGSHLPSHQYLSFGPYTTILLWLLPTLSRHSFCLRGQLHFLLLIHMSMAQVSVTETLPLSIYSVSPHAFSGVSSTRELTALVPAPLAILAPALDF